MCVVCWVCGDYFGCWCVDYYVGMVGWYVIDVCVGVGVGVDCFGLVVVGWV